MRKLLMKIELEYDSDLIHADNEAGVEWFFNDVLKGELFLHSNEIGDTIGEVRVLEILNGPI